MVAVNRNEVFYLFPLFRSRHYMFRPVRAIWAETCSDVSDIEEINKKLRCE
jgi:hypothetical protein